MVVKRAWGYWWLRSPNNNNSNNARVVNNNGNVNNNNNVNNTNNGVRPDLSYYQMNESMDLQDDTLGKVLVF